MSMKRVWLNINTGQFSNSWIPGELGDASANKPEVQQEMKEKGWKLIEYHCINDSDFIFYDRMVIKDKLMKVI